MEKTSSSTSSYYALERKKRVALVALTVIAAACMITSVGVYLWSIETDQPRLAVFINAFGYSTILFSVFLGLVLATPSFKMLKLTTKNRTS